MRQLESLIRLSEAMAKMECSDNVRDITKRIMYLYIFINYTYIVYIQQT